MVSRAVVLTLVGWVFVASAQADLQLTPTLTEHELDGVKFKSLSFSDGTGKDIRYMPPIGWDFAGSADRLSIHPPNKPQAEGTISVTRGLPADPAPFTDESVKSLTEEAIASVPKDSTSVKVTGTDRNPVYIGRKETILVTLSYTYYGQNFGRSIMLLNRGTEQVRFQFTSRLEDFEQLQRSFLRSQFGWENL